MTVDELMQQLEETERLIAVYRNADEVIVGTQDQIYSGLINRTTFTAAEIGGSRPSSECRFATVAEGPSKGVSAGGNDVCGHCGGSSDRGHDGLCCGWNTTIKPCTFGAPLRGCGA